MSFKFKVDQSTVKPTWRQILSQEFSKLLCSQSDLSHYDEDSLRHNRILVQHALRSFVSLIKPLTSTFLLVLLIMTNLPFFKERTYIFA